MILMEIPSRTETLSAQLFSSLSGRPAHVNDDVFVWNSIIMHRALAIVLLLKRFKRVPINREVMHHLYASYTARFENHALCFKHNESDTSSWFHYILQSVFNLDHSNNKLHEASDEYVKDMLIILHR